MKAFFLSLFFAFAMASASMAASDCASEASIIQTFESKGQKPTTYKLNHDQAITYLVAYAELAGIPKFPFSIKYVGGLMIVEATTPHTMVFVGVLPAGGGDICYAKAVDIRTNERIMLILARGKA
jgi:cytolysin (calcineurin-like family phosphatase)